MVHISDPYDKTWNTNVFIIHFLFCVFPYFLISLYMLVNFLVAVLAKAILLFLFLSRSESAWFDIHTSKYIIVSLLSYISLNRNWPQIWQLDWNAKNDLAPIALSRALVRCSISKQNDVGYVATNVILNCCYLTSVRLDLCVFLTEKQRV